jgi:acetylornithine/succinyldiaminopimelate/putrescine aminotransferase
VTTRAAELNAALDALASRHRLVVASRGRGLLRGLALDGERAPELVAALHRRGVLAAPAGKDVLRLAPPLIVSSEEIALVVARLDEALAEVEAT